MMKKFENDSKVYIYFYTLTYINFCKFISRCDFHQFGSDVFIVPFNRALSGE